MGMPKLSLLSQNPNSDSYLPWLNIKVLSYMFPVFDFHYNVSLWSGEL